MELKKLGWEVVDQIHLTHDGIKCQITVKSTQTFGFQKQSKLCCEKVTIVIMHSFYKLCKATTQNALKTASISNWLQWFAKCVLLSFPFRHSARRDGRERGRKRMFIPLYNLPDFPLTSRSQRERKKTDTFLLKPYRKKHKMRVQVQLLYFL